MPDDIDVVESHFRDLQNQRLSAPIGGASWQQDYVAPSGHTLADRPVSSVMTTDDLIGGAITGRQRIQERRNEIIAQLPYANRRQRYALTAELRGLVADEHFNEWQANQERVKSHQDAVEADREIRRERDTRIDQEGADAMMRMNTLDSALKTGQITKDQFDDEMLSLGQTHFEALHRHPEAAKHWAEYLDQDHKQSQYQDRLMLREASKLSTKYGVPMQVNPDTGEVNLEGMRQATLATPLGKHEALDALNKEMVRRYQLPLSAVFEHAAGGRMDDPQNPKTFKQTDPNDAQNPQTHVAMSLIGQGGAHQVILDKPRFDAIKNEFTPAYQAIVGAGQSAPATTPATVRMRAPDGSERDVPQDQVSHYQQRGATLLTQ